MVAVAALGALIATSAMASMSESAKWVKGGAGLTKAETAVCKADGEIEMRTNIGTTPVIYKATGLECLETRIYQQGTTAVLSGKLKFTGFSMISPAGCTVPSTITTEPITGEIYLSSTKAYEKLSPTSGTTWFTVPMTVCSLASSPKMTGSLFARFKNATGTEWAPQELELSNSINQEAGGSLAWGTKSVSFTGDFDEYLGSLGTTTKFGFLPF
jgi:hypothetical protein